MDFFSESATLLILTSKEEESEGIVRTLRNGGIAVQGIFVSVPGSLEKLTSADSIKLILCCEYDPDIDLDTWMSRYRELEHDVPLIIIADEETDSAGIIEAMRGGARDLIRRGDTDHLQLVVARELADLEHRRNENHLQSRLEECEKRSRDIVDAAGEAVAFIMEGMHVQVNPAYQGLFGFDSIDDLDGYPLLDLIGGDSHQKVRDTVRSVERKGATEPAELDVECIRSDGEQFEAHLSISRSQLEGDPCVRVIAEMRVAEADKSAPGTLDKDTGLPNRAALMEELESRLVDDGTDLKPFTMLYVGINIFPILLQDRGLTGALKAAARFGAYLQELAPESAYLARARDDGYLLLASDLGYTETDKLTARIRQKARLPIEQDSRGEDAIQCGTGLTFVDTRNLSPEGLLDKAYRNYILGMLEPAARDSKSVSSKEGDSSGALLEEERRISERIQHALDVEGFQLFYQPIVSLKGDRQENYNVLLRLREEDGTLREARDFLKIADRSGTIAAVDRWVFRNAIAVLAEQREKEQEVNFFVNLAEATLKEEKVLVWICDCLRDYKVRGNWLTLQVLEEHARSHAAAFVKLSDGLKKVSCRIALNRFGEGQNLETLLRNLRLDYAKFSPDLGKGLADDRAKQRRVQELTKLCRDAGVKSVVTGVEDARSLTVLWTAGIDYVQGNFLQQPSPRIDQE